jgi:hypothetical protein
MKIVSIMIFIAFVVAAVFALQYGLSQLPVPDGGVVSITAMAPTVNADIYKIVYKSDGDDIYGLLSVPKTAGRHPAFIIMPAQSIPKEDGQRFAGTQLNRLGFAAFSIDERGQGETKAQPNSLQDDFRLFVAGQKTSQEKMVDDVLNALKVLEAMPEIDAARIYVWGESMGGRFAVIAAANEPKLKGVIMVSSSGYGMPKTESADGDRFFRLIDPDYYISKIYPRKVVMLHGLNDTVIPFQSAMNTYLNAAEPKHFYALNSSLHGYLREGTGLEAFVTQELASWK